MTTLTTLPTLEEIAQKLEDIIAEHVEFEQPMNHYAAMVNELGFDSLDLIETSFCIQEHFDFEFSDKNALEALDKALGGGVVIAEGKLTPLGLEMVIERMPELADVDLGSQLSPMDLQKHFSMITFARLIQEFLAAAPQTCAETGEAVSFVDLVPRTSSGLKPVGLVNGDALLDAWVEKAVERLRAQT